MTFGREKLEWCGYPKVKQELSCRKQIARQLRTQFVEFISVTLKSTLRVTQGHWKQNRWTDHTRLTIRRVIGRWILSWPWNVGQRSLKVIESGTIWKFGYGFLTFFYPNPNPNPNPKVRGQGHWKWRRLIDHMRLSIGPPFKYSSILYNFRVIWRWIISWPWNRG